MRRQTGRLARVRRAPLAAQVAEQLRREIATAERAELGWRPRLPSERALAERFGISRSTLREALFALRYDGMTEPRHGEGTFVVRRDSRWQPFPALAATCSAGDALELLRGIELEAARLACSRWRSAHVQRLTSTAIELEVVVVHDETRAAEADRTFHRTLAMASGNRLLAELAVHLLRRLASIRPPYLHDERTAAAGAWHGQLADAVARRDRARALRAVLEIHELEQPARWAP